MDEFYVKTMLKTMEPVGSRDDLIVSIDTVELQKPELLRLDFSKTKKYVHRQDDGTLELELYGYEFDYDTYKMDYEKLGLEPWDFNADYFDSIFNAHLKLTELIVDCTDRNNPEKPVPLSLEKIQLVFRTDIGETVIDLTNKVTSGCREKLVCTGEHDVMQIVDVLSKYGEYDAFCESFANALLTSIATDDEKSVRLGHYALKAINENNFEDFLIAICGFSLESLMRRALIIPNDTNQFHEEIEKGIYVSIWDDGIRKEAPCKVNTKTRQVYDIEYSPDKADEELIGCEGEFVIIDDVEFPLIPKDEFESGRKLAFWYGEDE